MMTRPIDPPTAAMATTSVAHCLVYLHPCRHDPSAAQAYRSVNKTMPATASRNAKD